MNSDSDTPRGRILLTGASGYVGGRLLSLLLEKGHEVRCLTRRESSKANFGESPVEIAVGNALELESLGPALSGIHTAYYFIHSMGDNEDFEQTDRKAAENFATACSNAGVSRIVYLGGLGRSADSTKGRCLSSVQTGEDLAC